MVVCAYLCVLYFNNNLIGFVFLGDVHEGVPWLSSAPDDGVSTLGSMDASGKNADVMVRGTVLFRRLSLEQKNPATSKNSRAVIVNKLLEAAMRKLDRTDIEILSILQADGKTTNVSLSKQINLSATPCLERVKALESDGFITGYSANLSASQLGLGLTVFIEILLDHTSEEAFQKFRTAILNIPQVQECHMLAGGFDYLLKIRVPDMNAYRNFLGYVLSQVPGIRETHSYPVMEEVKDTPSISLDHLRS